MESPTKKKISAFRKRLISRATPAERKFMGLLNSISYRFIFQKPFFHRGNIFIVDFYLPNFQTVVEIDGGYHKDKEVEDQRRTFLLLKKKRRITCILRFTNEEIFTRPDNVINQLKGIQGLFPTKNVPNVKQIRVINRTKNFEVERLNEIKSIVMSDQNLNRYQKTRMLNELSTK